jgi:hypothetical protein
VLRELQDKYSYPSQNPGWMRRRYVPIRSKEASQARDSYVATNATFARLARILLFAKKARSG